MSLKGHVAIVTGASGGIGSVISRALAARGVKLVLGALPDDALFTLSRELQHDGAEVLTVPLDITQRAEIERMVAQALVTFRRVDILVNVAGIGSAPALGDSSDAELESVLAVNLLGTARAIHAVLPIMRAQQRGSIVNIGSVAGEVGVMGIYSASKFGVRGLTDTVRREVRSDNIGVTLIEPGFVSTTMNGPSMRGMPPPDIVADAVVDAILRPSRVRIVPGNYRWPVFITRLLPGFTDLVFGDARIQKRLNRDSRTARAAAANAVSALGDNGRT